MNMNASVTQQVEFLSSGSSSPQATIYRRLNVFHLKDKLLKVVPVVSTINKQQ
jgi:hypothetical protein